MLCYYFTFSQFRVFHFFGSVLVYRQSLPCAQTSVSALDSVSFIHTVWTCFHRGSTSFTTVLVVLLVSAVIMGEPSSVSLPKYNNKKSHKYPAITSHSSSFNSKFGCFEREVLFERQMAFPKCQ
jgi:hypothetical protein